MSLVLLRRCLGLKSQQNEATILTILVLATIEVRGPSLSEIAPAPLNFCHLMQEYLGDLVNLINHHQAAAVLVKNLLTPESTTLNEVHGNIFSWYSRFDILSAVLSAAEPTLTLDWYCTKEQYDSDKAKRDLDPLTD